MPSLTDRISAAAVGLRYDLRAVALPPLRPAAFFCAVVPPCELELRDELEPELLPPRLDAPDELAIFAARSFDIPLSFRASYCFSFFTFARLPGLEAPFGRLGGLFPSPCALRTAYLRRIRR
jgi:hypothetical protein